MKLPENAGHLAFDVGSIATISWVIFKEIRTRMVQGVINRNFIYEMATNHLPHIYKVLSAITKHLGMEDSPASPWTTPPNITFIDVNKKEK